MTPRRTYQDYLQDILEAATHAAEFIAGIDLDAFRQDTGKVYREDLPPLAAAVAAILQAT